MAEETIEEQPQKKSDAPVLEGGTYEIIDVGSRSGTYVNGQRVERERRPAGAILGVGIRRRNTDLKRGYKLTGTARTASEPVRAAY